MSSPIYPRVKDTSKQDAFRAELNALLDKYNVEMEVQMESDRYGSYPEIEFTNFDSVDAGDHFIDYSIEFTATAGSYNGTSRKV